MATTDDYIDAPLGTRLACRLPAATLTDRLGTDTGLFGSRLSKASSPTTTAGRLTGERDLEGVHGSSGRPTTDDDREGTTESVRCRV
jgi:hypothetical protein